MSKYNDRKYQYCLVKYRTNKLRDIGITHDGTGCGSFYGELEGRGLVLTEEALIELVTKLSPEIIEMFKGIINTETKK